jgi:hypothetical protein
MLTSILPGRMVGHEKAPDPVLEVSRFSWGEAAFKDFSWVQTL